MDTMRICVGNVADLLDKEFGLLVDHKFNKGLGESLKINKKSTHHGFKAMQITLSSLTADVIMNTVPASLHSRPTESFNQDKVSMGTTAALHFAKQLPDLTNMLSIAIMGMAQAVDLRGKSEVSSFLAANYDKVRAEVAPLEFDRRMDVDIKVINRMILEGTFA
jgi:histidine ammonia-lyase